MPRATRSSGSDDEVAQLRAREARLRARVEELEAELSRRESRRGTRSRTSSDISETTRDITDTTRDNSRRALDEVSKLARGVTLASLEALRATTEAVDTLVSSVYDRNRPEEEDSVQDLARRLPGDLTVSFMDAVERVFDVPNRAVDTLHSSYRETESRRRQSRSSRGQDREEREDDDIRHALGRPVTRVILDAQDNVILNTGEVITNQAIQRARRAGVLDILLDSVYEGEPVITSEELRASEQGSASLEEQRKS